MERITKRIGESVDFNNKYIGLSHEDGVKLLFKSLADCEDRLEEITTMKAYRKTEDFVNESKDIPLEIKAAMIWGALTVVCNQGDLTLDKRKSIFGDFMSKQLNLS